MGARPDRCRAGPRDRRAGGLINSNPYDDTRQAQVLISLGIAVAVGLSRRLPGVALAVVWLTGAHPGAGRHLDPVRRARHRGGRLRRRPLGQPGHRVAERAVDPGRGRSSPWRTSTTRASARSRGSSAPARRWTRPDAVGTSWPLVAGAFGFAVLAVPWLAGLALRFQVRAVESQVSQVAAEEDAARAQRETEQAREIAGLREEQARLARDVHDVVGHSLAVILAQAESAQYLPDDDPAALKKTMATIATSARSSLQDVRHVLAGPHADAAAAHRRLRAAPRRRPGQRAPGGRDRGGRRRSRCRRSSSWSPTGSPRRCSPTRSSTAAATGR